MWCVYAISDPKTREIFYVGYTGNFKQRIVYHCEKPQGAVGDRIKEIQEQGLEPVFVILQKCETEKDALASEIYWIQSFSGRIELLNKMHTLSTSERKQKRQIMDSEAKSLEDLESKSTDNSYIRSVVKRNPSLPKNTGKQWGRDDNEYLLNAVKSGMSYEDIAVSLERGVDGIIQQHKRLNNCLKQA